MESLGSAWGTLEALGKNSFSNFLLLYISESIPALAITLLFTNNYDNVINFALTLMSIAPFIVIIPSVLIGILIKDKNLMMNYKYGRTRMIIYWITVAMILTGGILAII